MNILTLTILSLSVIMHTSEQSVIRLLLLNDSVSDSEFISAAGDCNSQQCRALRIYNMRFESKGEMFKALSSAYEEDFGKDSFALLFKMYSSLDSSANDDNQTDRIKDIAIQERNPWVLFQLALIRMADNQVEGRDILRKCLDYDAYFYPAAMELAYDYRMEGAYMESIKLLKPLSFDFDTDDLLLMLGEAYLQTNEPVKSLTCFGKVGKRTKSWEAFWGIAKAKWLIGSELDEVDIAYERALALSSNWELKLDYAWYLFNTSRVLEAKKIIEQYMEQNDEWKGVSELVLFHIRMDDSKKAHDLIEFGKNNYGHSFYCSTLELLLTILDKGGDSTAAETLLNQFRNEYQDNDEAMYFLRYCLDSPR